MNIEGGTTRRGRAQREFCPSRFGRERGVILQPLRASLLLFLVNFFRLVDRHFLRVNRSRRAELGGRIQCGRKSTVEFGNISDGKKLFCVGTEQYIFSSPLKGAQRGRVVFLHVIVIESKPEC